MPIVLVKIWLLLRLELFCCKAIVFISIQCHCFDFVGSDFHQLKSIGEGATEKDGG